MVASRGVLDADVRYGAKAQQPRCYHRHPRERLERSMRKERAPSSAIAKPNWITIDVIPVIRIFALLIALPCGRNCIQLSFEKPIWQ